MENQNYASGEHYRSFATRIQRYLKDIANMDVELSNLYPVIVECLDYQDFEYGYAILSPSKPDWQAILMGSAISQMVQDSFDALTVERTKTEAMAATLEALDRSFQTPTALSSGKDKIEFYAGDEVIASIVPMCFEEVNVVGRQRVVSVFKGIRQHHDARLAKRLKNIPGFEGITTDSVSVGYGGLLLPSAANFAIALREDLEKELNIQLKQHQAQEIIARAFGAKNWATFVAKEEENTNDLWIPTVLFIHNKEGDVGDPPEYLTFRTPADAIWALGQRIKHHPVPLVPRVTNSLNGFYATAETSDDVSQNVFSSHGIMTLGYSDEYLKIAQKFSFKRSESVSKNIEAVMERRQIPLSDWKVYGDWLFWMEEVGGHTHLFAGPLEKDGHLTKRYSTAIYKASINTFQKPVIMGDYDSRFDIPIDSLSSEEIISLSEFSGMSISSRDMSHITAMSYEYSRNAR